MLESHTFGGSRSDGAEPKGAGTGRLAFVPVGLTGHSELDFAQPGGTRPWAPWTAGEPWFPPGASERWEDLYRTWFGERDKPVVNFNLMGGAPPEWDERIRRAYGGAWERLRDGGLDEWEGTAKGRVAKMILADQIPRHLFRGQPEAFSTDAVGLRLAERLAADIAGGAGLHVEDAFMVAWPWVHAEDLESTMLAVWWHGSIAEAARGTAYHLRSLLNRFGAERHARIVQRFGRYPHRNAILGRASSPAEAAHLAHPDLWELQQSVRHATFDYRLRAVAFFVQTGIYMLASGDGDALRSFAVACWRRPRAVLPAVG